VNMWLIAFLLMIVLFVTLTWRVIKRRARSEDALQATRDRLDAVTGTLGVGMAIISKDYITLWANKVLKENAGEVEGVRCYYMFFQRNEICPGCGLRRIMGKKSERIEIEVEGKDRFGNKLWYQVITTPILDKKDNVTSVKEMLIPITERKKADEERERLISELETALTEVKTLSGLLPICASCKKIRDDKGYWNQIESYIANRTDARFTHGICPDCKKELYPELFGDKK
jgi:hypothetical protein